MPEFSTILRIINLSKVYYAGWAKKTDLFVS